MGVVLLVFVIVDSIPCYKAVGIDFGEFSICGKAGDVEIDGTILCICESFINQALRHAGHLRNMFCCSGIVVGFKDVQCFDVLKEGFGIFTGIFMKTDAAVAGALDGFIVDIRDVHHVFDLIAAEQEKSFQKVFENVGSEVPDMGEIINGGAACI